MEITLHVFLLGGVFLPCDHGLDFGISACVRIQSMNQTKTSAEVESSILLVKTRICILASVTERVRT